MTMNKEELNGHVAVVNKTHALISAAGTNGITLTSQEYSDLVLSMIAYTDALYSRGNFLAHAMSGLWAIYEDVLTEIEHQDRGFNYGGLGRAAYQPENVRIDLGMSVSRVGGKIAKESIERDSTGALKRQLTRLNATAVAA